MCYATLTNTIGIGNAVPAGGNSEVGSGDRFDTGAKGKKKPSVAKKKQHNPSEQLPNLIYLKH